MNRLVIVGNGFDLAHGLPTGYCDFIDWYWTKITSGLDAFRTPTASGNSYEDDIIKLNLQFGINFINDQFPIIKEFTEVNTYNKLIKFVEKYKRKSHQNHNDYYGNFDDCIISFKNSFFKIINDTRQFKNWVDIENEYYKLLKNCLTQEGDNSEVVELNEEFDGVKKLLEEYLQKGVQAKFDFNGLNSEGSQILNLFSVRPKDLQHNPDHVYLKEFPAIDHKDLIALDNQLDASFKLGDLRQDLLTQKIIQNNLILNFNYTSTFDRYENIMWHGQRDAYGYTRQIQIHGKLFDPNNNVNFGFGDEMDDHYKLLEEKDDNEYLKNIKSFQYLQNSNYRDLLNFIDDRNFQVYIMGHSCGLSDRILLNTVFEHQNCRSIKVFYYEKDGRDNYTEIVQNISRHFNKKKLMREKIVNKSLCQPLPQNIRFAQK